MANLPSNYFSGCTGFAQSEKSQGKTFFQGQGKVGNFATSPGNSTSKSVKIQGILFLAKEDSVVSKNIYEGIDFFSLNTDFITKGFALDGQ